MRQWQVLRAGSNIKGMAAGGVAIDSDAGGRKSRPGRDEESKIMIFHLKL